MSNQRDYDEMFMQHAISLAIKGWGKTAINPLVGATVVKNNRIVGQGFHRKIGEAHAEVCALIDAGGRTKDATLYVNLEPCCCVGRTPPCVEAIFNAGIKRVVIGTTDPNPAVNGKGIEFLRQNNIDVTLNVLKIETEQLNLWYKKYITEKIPYLILKIAASSDWKIAGFKEKYISSEPSRRLVHSLRSQVSAIMVGIKTIIKDDPYLTDRLVGRNNPTRIVIDPHLRIPLNAKFLDATAKRIIITSRNGDPLKIENLTKRGVEFIIFDGDFFPMEMIIKKLGSLDVGSLLVEGGAIVVSQVLSEKLFDEIYLFVAPKVIDEGLSIKEDIFKWLKIEGIEPLKIGEDLLYHVYRNN